MRKTIYFYGLLLQIGVIILCLYGPVHAPGFGTFRQALSWENKSRNSEI